MIHGAGFDGAGVRFFDRAYAREVTQNLRGWGLTWQAQCYPHTVDDLKPILDHVAEFGADHVNLQPDVRPHTVAECVPLIEGWRALAHDAGVPLHFETHRDRMTTDLFFTLRLLDCFPDLRLTGDLSHYVVGREFAWPISRREPRADAPDHRQLLGLPRPRREPRAGPGPDLASRTSATGSICSWAGGSTASAAGAGARRPMRRSRSCASSVRRSTRSPGRDGYELSDRWEEAQMLMRMVRELWQKLEQEDARQESALA